MTISLNYQQFFTIILILSFVLASILVFAAYAVISVFDKIIGYINQIKKDRMNFLKSLPDKEAKRYAEFIMKRY